MTWSGKGDSARMRRSRRRAQRHRRRVSERERRRFSEPTRQDRERLHRAMSRMERARERFAVTPEREAEELRGAVLPELRAGYRLQRTRHDIRLLRRRFDVVEPEEAAGADVICVVRVDSGVGWEVYPLPGSGIGMQFASTCQKCVDWMVRGLEA